MKKYVLISLIFIVGFSRPSMAINLNILPSYTEAAWNEGSNFYIIGYRFYYGIESGVYPNFVTIEGKGNLTKALSTIYFKVGTTYYIVVTAYTADEEGVYSNEVLYEKPSSVTVGGSKTLTIN